MTANLALASEPLLVEANVGKMGNSTSLAPIWVGMVKTGVVTAQLTWKNYDDKTQKLGFEFKEASSSQLVWPVLDGDCKLEQSNGYLMGSASPVPQGANPGAFSIKIVGTACEKIIQAIREDQLITHPIIIEYTNVPSFQGNQVYSSVRLIISKY
jgi:hypothetical protein